jgi:hypothetical protein
MFKFNFLLLFSLLFFMCGGGGPVPFDPTDVYILHTPFGDLTAMVAHNNIAYTASNWPQNFSDPIFTWKEIDPMSISTGQVNYATIIKYSEEESLWTYSPTDSEGCHYIYVVVNFNDGRRAVTGYSGWGIDLYRDEKMTDYDADECQKASTYINVPYIYGTIADVNGDFCGKTIDNGYRGNDCSGLAWYCGYPGDEGVGYTDCADLRIDYGKNLPVESLQLIFSPYSWTCYLDGCILLVNVNDEDHVGIILNQDVNYDHEVIHCTAAYQLYPWYRHGHMGMREDMEDRSYWLDNYIDIGRNDSI